MRKSILIFASFMVLGFIAANAQGEYKSTNKSSYNQSKGGATEKKGGSNYKATNQSSYNQKGKASDKKVKKKKSTYKPVTSSGYNSGKRKNKFKRKKR